MKQETTACTFTQTADAMSISYKCESQLVPVAVFKNGFVFTAATYSSNDIALNAPNYFITLGAGSTFPCYYACINPICPPSTPMT